jgi:superfamily I DNA/RNA helicase
VSSHEGEGSLGFGDIGVLFRLNAQGDALQLAMDRAGIPCIRSGEASLISHYPVNVLWRFLLTLCYPQNAYYQTAYHTLISDSGISLNKGWDYQGDESIITLINRAVTYHGLEMESEESMDPMARLRRQAGEHDGDLESFLDSLSLERGIDHAILRGDRVALMSLHAAKGLEWPVVFIIGCEDRLIPLTLYPDVQEDEERRLFYVGMTRARSRLIISHVKKRRLNGRVLGMKPSPFLKSIAEHVLMPLERRGWKTRKKAHKQLDLFS